jgi:hypothetical protein
MLDPRNGGTSPVEQPNSPVLPQSFSCPSAQPSFGGSRRDENLVDACVCGTTHLKFQQTRGNDDRNAIAWLVDSICRGSDTLRGFRRLYCSLADVDQDPNQGPGCPCTLKRSFQFVKVRARNPATTSHARKRE